MATEDNPDQVDRYLAENQDIRAWKAMESEKAHQLERDLKKMDIDGQVEMKKLETKAATMRLKATSRIDVWRRGLVGLIKLPVLPLAVICVFVLEVANKDIPEGLENFLEI